MEGLFALEVSEAPVTAGGGAGGYRSVCACVCVCLDCVDNLWLFGT